VRQNLERLVFGKPVTVDFTKTDRWRRVIAKIMVDANK
jgi:endonuclease YncB( thermonuclease family)